MIKICVFGAGKVARRIIRYINFNNVDILAIFDNNSSLWGKKKKFYYSSNSFKKIEILNPLKLCESDFDYVVIASSFYRQIKEQLLQMGVESNKILQCGNGECEKNSNDLKNIVCANYFEDSKNFTIGDYKLNMGESHTLPDYMKAIPLYDRIFSFLGMLRANDENGKGWIIDIGANVGDSLAFMIQNKDVSFLCIEPTQKYYDLLCENIKSMSKTDRERIVTKQCYITDDMSEKFTSCIIGGTAYKVKTENNEITAESVTLEQLLSREGICAGEIQVIKIDADGYDADCLLSCGNILKDSNAFLYWENEFENEQQYEKLLKAYQYLEKMGYCSFFIFDNFGNFLCSGGIEVLRQINEYLYRMLEFRSTRTFYYIDVLACKEGSEVKVNNMINEYLGF